MPYKFYSKLLLLTVGSRNMSAKAARSDPSWNPSIAGRELLKPKFYDVWFEVSGKKEAILTNSTATKVTGVKDGGALVRDLKTPGHNVSWKVAGKDGQPIKHKVEDCGTALKEMQRLMQVQLQVRLVIRFDSVSRFILIQIATVAFTLFEKMDMLVAHLRR